MLIFAAFQIVACTKLFAAAAAAQQQSVAKSGMHSTAVRNTGVTACLLAMSGLTTVILCGLWAARRFSPDVEGIYYAVLTLDALANAGLAMVAASVVGPA